jgi:hypothetical protein
MCESFLCAYGIAKIMHMARKSSVISTAPIIGLLKNARPSVSIEFTAMIVATEAPETTMASMTMVAETLSNAL